MILALLPLAACAPTGDGGDGVQELVPTELHRTRIDLAARIDSVPAQAEVDVTLDWSGLATDLHGQPVAPDTIDHVALVSIRDDSAEVFGKVSSGAHAYLTPTTFGEASLAPGTTAVRLSDLAYLGTHLGPPWMQAETYQGEPLTSIVLLSVTGGESMFASPPRLVQLAHLDLGAPGASAAVALGGVDSEVTVGVEPAMPLAVDSQADDCLLDCSALVLCSLGLEHDARFLYGLTLLHLPDGLDAALAQPWALEEQADGLW